MDTGMSKREKEISKILHNLESWVGDIDSGLDIIYKNKEYFDQLKEVDIVFTEEEQEMLKTVFTKQNELIEFLNNKRITLKNNIMQISKKDLVTSNYISQKMQPIFVDKDFN